MKTVADLKRRLVVGAQLEIIRHDYLVADHSLVGLVRKIETRRTNSITFEPAPGKESGSRLDFPKAKNVNIKEDGFEVCLSGDGSFTKLMAYVFRDEVASPQASTA